MLESTKPYLDPIGPVKVNVTEQYVNFEIIVSILLISIIYNYTTPGKIKSYHPTSGLMISDVEQVKIYLSVPTDDWIFPVHLS